MIWTDSQKDTDLTVVIYQSPNSVRDQDVRTDTNTQQPQQSTGSKTKRIRSYRSVSVCLVLLCVLLLTAVTVMCVLIYTNYHQFHINNKNITQEKDQLQIKYTNITEERDQLLTKYTNITEERDQLLTKYTNITQEKDQLQIKYTNIRKEREELQTKIDDLNKQIKQLNQEKNDLLKTLHEKDGWIYFSCYFISSETKTWTESRRYCRERGADLISINNKEEQDFIHNNYGRENVWIGLSDEDEEGRWKWVDGSSMTSGSWGIGEPNGQRNENCIMSHESVWYDYSCDSRFKFICEKICK